jgi:hypothetical protein
MIDAKWDQIIDRTVIVLAVLTILFAMLAGLMISVGHFMVTVGEERKIVSANEHPAFYWGVTAACAAVSVGSAVSTALRVRARKRDEENA